MRAVPKRISGFLAFWWDVVKRAVRLARDNYKRADFIGGFLVWCGVGVSAWLDLIPLRWLLIGGVLFCLYVVMLAVYEKFREVEAEREELEKRVVVEERREGFRAVLVEALKDGQKLFYSNSSTEEAEKWGNTVYVVVQTALGQSEADYIFIDTQFKAGHVPIGSPHRIWLGHRLERL